MKNLKWFALATCVALTGCAVDVAGELPTDEGGPDGKGDRWNAANDPANFDSTLEYSIEALHGANLDQLRSGRATNPAWPSDYFPTYKNSIDHRWNTRALENVAAQALEAGYGEFISSLSPAEKYDAVFNGWQPNQQSFQYARPFEPGEVCRSGAWDRDFYDQLGPLATWVANNLGNKASRNGVDDDGDGMADECDDNDGVESWWGLCHAWVPASMIEPAPMRPVVRDGVTFYPGDLEALLIAAYNRSGGGFLGGRCNDGGRDYPGADATVAFDAHGRATKGRCRDTNPGAFHVVMANFLGKNGRMFAEDRTYDTQVWNQPVVGYDIREMQEIDQDRAYELLGQVDAFRFDGRELFTIDPYATTASSITLPEFQTNTVSIQFHIRTKRAADLTLFLVHGNERVEVARGLADGEIALNGFGNVAAGGTWTLEVEDAGMSFSPDEWNYVDHWSLLVTPGEVDQLSQTYLYNRDAARLYYVKSELQYISESFGGETPAEISPATRTDTYEYVLEVDGNGKIIGGEWIGSSRRSHPDFLWTANRLTTSSVPNLDLDVVRAMVEESRRP